jgi:hypothetical protein
MPLLCWGSLLYLISLLSVGRLVCVQALVFVLYLVNHFSVREVEVC